jgi:hypothetical protein
MRGIYIALRFSSFELFSSPENDFKQQLEVVTFEMVALKLEASGPTEMFIPICQTTLYVIQEDFIFSKNIL